MQENINTKLAQIEQDLAALGDEPPHDSFEQKNIVMKLASRFGIVLRQVSLGDYRDVVVRDLSSVHIKYSVDAALREMHAAMTSNIPVMDVDSGNDGGGIDKINPSNIKQKQNPDSLTQELLSLRGREPPGFMSVRLILSTTSTDMDRLRTIVDNAVSRTCEEFLRAAHTLVYKVAPKHPQLCEALFEIVEEKCSHYAAKITRKIDEIFEQNSGGYLGGGAMDRTQVLAHVNKCRQERWESELKAVLDTAMESKGQGKMTKEDLKAHFKPAMGKAFHELHEIQPSGTSSAQILDLQSALCCYWKTVENRLQDSVAATIDLTLLKEATEDIESTLLSLVQQWDSTTILSCFNEDDSIVMKREALRKERDALFMNIIR